MHNACPPNCDFAYTGCQKIRLSEEKKESQKFQLRGRTNDFPFPSRFTAGLYWCKIMKLEKQDQSRSLCGAVCFSV